MTPTPLPELLATPTRQPLSCCSLSLPLLSTLNSLLPAPPHLTLSIGSGPGLFEALLLRHHPARSHGFYGVEVAVSSTQLNRKPVNIFLPEENILTVNGTWAVVDEELLDKTGGLVFVYPRQPSLVRAYLDKWQGGEKGEAVVVWIGPRADLEMFAPVFEEWAGGKKGGYRGEGAVEEGEGVWVYRRR